MRPTVPRRDRRFPWFRLYSDFAAHPKWRLLARAAGVTLSEALAVGVYLMCHANKSRPRGSLADFSPLECAAALDLEAEQVRAAYDELERLGWIDQDHLVTWDERNPDVEDPTAAERQRRRRAKAKAERIGEPQQSAANDAGPARKTVTVTHRDVTPEESRYLEDAAKAADERAKAESLEIATKATGERQLAVRVQLSRWLAAVRGNAVDLLNIVKEVDRENVRGDRFKAIVTQRTEQRRKDAQASLPLGPVKIEGGRR
jgi:hypothetical protein